MSLYRIFLLLLGGFVLYSIKNIAASRSGIVRGVYADGSTVYAATKGGLSISTDGGATFNGRRRRAW
jgi:hypothetical protein